MSIFSQGLAPSPVNHQALSPLSFIERTATVYGQYPAVIHGAIRRNWQQTYERSRRLASALAGRGIGQGDTVAVMLPNISSFTASTLSGTPSAALNFSNTLCAASRSP
jgi:fatty-acyl-CoA synthase